MAAVRRLLQQRPADSAAHGLKPHPIETSRSRDKLAAKVRRSTISSTDKRCLASTKRAKSKPYRTQRIP